MKISDLKGRRRQVAELIAKGHTCADIERILGMSKNNAHNTRARVFSALGVRTDMQVFALALREVFDSLGSSRAAAIAASDMVREVLP